MILTVWIFIIDGFLYIVHLVIDVSVQRILFCVKHILLYYFFILYYECAVGGVRHPQHTQTGSNSSTIAADSSNGVTNARCCRYSCMRSFLMMGGSTTRNM
jgi:hypothetical protein